MSVADEIRAAFSGASRLPAHDYVRGNRWQDDEIVEWLEEHFEIIDDQFVDEFSDCLPNFTEAGLLRVLPRFMDYCLRHPFSQTMEYVVSKIRNMGSSGLAVTLLTSNQRKSVRLFLEASKDVFYSGGHFAAMIEYELRPGSPWLTDDDKP